MKKNILIIVFAFISLNALGQTDESNYQEFLEKSPFNRMYPKSIASEAAQYFTDWNKLFFIGTHHNERGETCSNLCISGNKM